MIDNDISGVVLNRILEHFIGKLILSGQEGGIILKFTEKDIS